MKDPSKDEEANVISSIKYVFIIVSLIIVTRSGTIDFSSSSVIDKIYLHVGNKTEISSLSALSKNSTLQVVKISVDKPDYFQKSKSRISLHDALTKFNAIRFDETYSTPVECLTNIKSCSPGPFIESLNINVENTDIDLYNEKSHTDLNRTLVSQGTAQDFTIQMFTKHGQPRLYGGDFITTGHVKKI